MDDTDQTSKLSLPAAQEVHLLEAEYGTTAGTQTQDPQGGLPRTHSQGHYSECGTFDNPNQHYPAH